jgi:hypothetical protein
MTSSQNSKVMQVVVYEMTNAMKQQVKERAN